MRLPELATSTPSPARIYDYFLGGKDNFPADREVAEAILALLPEAPALAQENRAFLRRAVRFLVGEAGIRQFIDIGAGLPTENNTHQVAQAVAPDARVVYIDNDPSVVTHGQALLAGNSTVVIQADLREPGMILQHPELLEVVDRTQPVAILVVSVLQLIADEDDPAGIVAQLRDGVVPGSYLVLSHASADFWPELGARIARLYQQVSAPLVTRSYAQIERLFAGLELVAPGLVPTHSWRPDDQAAPDPKRFAGYAGVGRKREPEPDYGESPMPPWRI